MSTIPISLKTTVLGVSCCIATACDAGQVSLVQPDGTSGGSPDIEIHVTLEDSALAASLGWADGVPGAGAEWAFVQFQRYLFHGAQSDSAGVIAIEPEGQGWHWIAAEKEIEIDGEKRVLGGGAKTQGSAELALNLDRPGTLVISEIYMERPPPWEAEGYTGGMYIELYNNSQGVLYLDGTILGTAYGVSWDGSRFGHHSCAYTRSFREDPDGVWSRSHWRLPGSGTEYPIAPGQAVVVAVSAADHTGVHPSMLDLSDADFEFGLVGQADNPAAANLEDVSSERIPDPLYLDAIWFVSSPLDIAELDVMTDVEYLYGDGVVYRRFPAESILDVAIEWWDATSAEPLTRVPPCEHPIHPRFDALPGGYLYGEIRPEDLLVSPQRRVVRTEDGRAILLDTNTSAVDFENRERTPGWIPGPEPDLGGSL